MYSIGASTVLALAVSSPAGIKPPPLTPTFNVDSTAVCEFAASVSTSGAWIAVIDPFLALTVGLVTAHFAVLPNSVGVC
jgi:hypothetical protein